MTREENIKAILNAHFVGFKDEIIDSATNTICGLKQEPFINKPCVSAGVCEHDKMQVLDNLRAEIMELQTYKLFNGEDTTVYVERNDLLEIIDKHRVESEGKE